MPSSTDLKAGRALDARIAEVVMGWQRYKAIRNGQPFVTLVATHQDCWTYTRSQGDRRFGTWEPTSDPISDGVLIPAYSTDPAAAWQVVERLARLDPHPAMVTVMNWNSYGDRHYSVSFRSSAPGGRGVEAYAPTVPLAICRAALLVLEAPRD